MADWKTYARAARNTARKQAPEVKRSAQESARRGSQRAGDYVRAAGRVVEESRRDDSPDDDDRPGNGERSPQRQPRREYDPRPVADPSSQDSTVARDRPAHRRLDQDRASDQDPAPDQDHAPDREGGPHRDRRPAVDTDRLRRGAAAYYTVAERRVRSAQLGPRIMRAVRDALLIGLSIFAIWLVLAAAGLQIPLSAVLIAVGVIVLISFGTSLYASSKRAREPADDDGDATD